VAWGRYCPQTPDLLADIIADLDATADWRAAVEALAVGAFGGVGGDALRAAIERLASAPEGPQAEADRDRPAAQRLEAITARVGSLAKVNPVAAVPVVELVAALCP
jgi:hypothetical protein